MRRPRNRTEPPLDPRTHLPYWRLYPEEIPLTACGRGVFEGIRTSYDFDRITCATCRKSYPFYRAFVTAWEKKRRKGP